jgi:hypothetical protein
MNQDSTRSVTGVGRAGLARADRRVAQGRPVHVMTLLAAMPLIGILAALMTWLLGASGWQIGLSVLASWLLIQLIYAGQVAYYAARSNSELQTDWAEPRSLHSNGESDGAPNSEHRAGNRQLPG